VSGGMAAFVGGDADAVCKLAIDTDLDIANINSPGQIALSGPTLNIQKAIELAKSYGIRRAVPLNVAGAFHSRWMKQAEEKLRRDLAKAQIAEPRATVVANVTARPALDVDEIRKTLTEQVSGSIRWVESIEYLLDRVGCDLFLELGPGEVVAGLVNRIRKGAKVISLGDVASLEAGLKDLKEELK
ncbi:MAG: ACP S-malonyltransferase, partial [Verrucomicrobia bacterium]|nr:ACP S-malonyltransferase [Verrucomicrobiota bacterium]